MVVPPQLLPSAVELQGSSRQRGRLVGKSPGASASYHTLNRLLGQRHCSPDPGRHPTIPCLLDWALTGSAINAPEVAADHGLVGIHSHDGVVEAAVACTRRKGERHSIGGFGNDACT